jgi:virginiamycin A acetyltransferase
MRPAITPQRLRPICIPAHPEQLAIGRFCQIAHGVRFITSSANHAMDGFSTYPFAVLNPDLIGGYAAQIGNRRDTVVGNDVWFGFESLVMPGVRIGHGAIIAARAVVTADVPDYAIVGGNPGRVIRRRYPEDIVERLLDIAWWDWDLERIGRNVDAITGADIAALERGAG